MSDDEWVTATAPEPILALLQERWSDRKARLFAVGCCRRLSDLLPDALRRRSLAAIEQFAEISKPTMAQHFELEAAYAVAESHAESLWQTDPGSPERQAARAVADAAVVYSPAGNNLLEAVAHNATELAELVQANAALRVAFARDVAKRARRARQDQKREAQGQADLLRDLTWNCLRAVMVDSRWLTPTVTLLATAIYKDRAFDRVPILTDALEEAGCRETQILAHCRSPNEHFLGCWVVDLLLGKE
jgi:hypothetical protein